MPLEFDLNNIQSIEFGVGREDHGDIEFCAVPVDANVQATLGEMARETWNAMQKNAEEPAAYEPSEKYASAEYLCLPNDSPEVARLLPLHTAENLPLDTDALADPNVVSCYFARLIDHRERRLTAFRRASYFKGLLKNQNRLVRIVDDTLKVVEDSVFKLDHDFDVFIDSKRIHIWRPSSFEFIGNLQQVILDSVPQNVDIIRKDIPFVNFDSIQEYASARLRAARYLSSIKSQNLTGIDSAALEGFCRKTNIEISSLNGSIVVAEGHVMSFLEVLDRRRYIDELDPNIPELYRASSRQRIRE